MLASIIKRASEFHVAIRETSRRKQTQRRAHLASAVWPIVESLEDRRLFGGGDGDKNGIVPTDPGGTPGPPGIPCKLAPTTGTAATQPSTGSSSPGAAAITSSEPITLLSGKPDDIVTDLLSNDFGQPWGVTRAWVGEPDTGLTGNGWLNTSTPFLIIVQNDHGHVPIISVEENGVSESTFTGTWQGSGNYTFTPTGNNQQSLTYIPSQTIGGTKMPGEFSLTDTTGNITSFFDLPRDGSGRITALGSYTLETASTDPGQTDQFQYSYGAFAGYQNAAGVMISTVYDQTTTDPGYGQLLETDRSNGSSNPQERFFYKYTTISNTLLGANSTPVVSEIDWQQRANSTSPYTTNSYVAYTYYNGTDSNDSALGRLGDLKTVTTHTIVNGTDGVTNTDYYRYNKFFSGNSNFGATAYNGPTDDPHTTGGPSDASNPFYDISLGTSNYTGDNSMVFSGLSAVVQGTSYLNLLAAEGGTFSNIDSSSLTNTALAPYADYTFSYIDPSSGHPAEYLDSTIQYGSFSSANDYRVMSETVGGAGCGCSGVNGAGTYSYSYTVNSASNDPNHWVVKAIETMPDSTIGNPDQIVTYTNGSGEVMMTVAISGTVANVTYYRYDSSGRLILIAEPSAISHAYSISQFSYSDLVGWNGSSYVNISPNSGLIQLIDYGIQTTANSTFGGDVAGYVKDTKIQQGYLGVPILQTSQTYFVQQINANSPAIYPLARSTVYRNIDGTGAETTTFTNTYYTGTDQTQMLTTTAPAISGAQNGPGTADTLTTEYDIFGRPIWTKDADGFISYTAYDALTGAVIKMIQDVNTSDTSDFDSSTLPGWTTPIGGGKELITSTLVDAFGRPTQVTSPAGNITLMAYDDANHAVFTFPGASETISGGVTTLTTTGPAQMTRTQIPYAFTQNGTNFSGTYDETLSLSGSFTVSAGQVVLPGFTSSYDSPGSVTDVLSLGSSYVIQALSRTLYNNAGQKIESDAYAHIDNSTYLGTYSNGYSGSAIAQGSQSGNFYQTFYGYDHEGRQNRVQAPTNTISRTVYDGLGRVTSKWIGTNDIPSTGFWDPVSNTAGMKDVEDFYYDTNSSGNGDSTLTETITHPVPGANSYDRATLMWYDWRDRLVASKSGVLLSGGSENFSGELDGTNRVLSYTIYDNLGEAIESDTYAGDGIGLAIANGVPEQPSQTRLQSQTVRSYDDQGRVYRTQTFNVNPANGMDGSVTGLTNGTPYYFQVVGKNGTLSSSASNTTEATPTSSAGTVAAPVLNSVQPGNGQIGLVWNAVSGATGYNIYFGTSSGSYGTPIYVPSSSSNGTVGYTLN